ncbi:MAG: hypothetical protein HQ481_13515 [Alphaproteobacteria bacterium]|nr:hypothetical protein [Alphaproteobacteria bacterium]
MRHPGKDDPIALLCDLLTDGEQRVAMQAIGGRASPAVSALLRADLLVPDGVLETTICDACEVHHPVDVVFDAERGTHGWRCPEAGFVTADSDAVAMVSLSMKRTAAAVSGAFTDAFGYRRWALRPIAGAGAWVVGAWCIGGAWTTVILARYLCSASESHRTREALVRLSPNEAGLVLTIGDSEGFEPPRRFAAVPLAEAIAPINGSRLVADSRLLQRIVTPLAAGRLVAHAGRPGSEAKVAAVLEGLEARGDLPAGTKGLSGVVARAWEEFHPHEGSPAPSTLRKHIAAWRSRY